MIKKARDTVVGLALICFSGLIYGMTLQLPDKTSRGGLNPASFPRGLAIIIACLSLLLVIRGIIKDPTEKEVPLIGPMFWQMAAFFGMMVAYIWLMPLIGYAVSTFAFLMVSTLLIMSRRSPMGCIKGFVFALFATAFVYMTFGIFLRVPLIEGPVDHFLRYRIFAFLGAV